MAPTTQLPPPPATPIEPVTDILHGVPVTDPYRWLEEQNSPRTRKWLENQAAYIRAYFESIPGRDLIHARVSELLTISSISEAWNIGERFFYLKRYKSAPQAVIVMSNGFLGEHKVLVDPALRFASIATTVSIVDISGDGRFMAYAVRNGGTDHCSIEIIDIDQNKILSDGLEEGFCTGFAFAPNGSGFYYSHRTVHDARRNYQAAFWHEFGTERSRDREIFCVGDEPNLTLGIRQCPETDTLAYVAVSTGTQRRTSLFLHRPCLEAAPRLLLTDVQGFFAPFFAGSQLLAYTDSCAPNFRIVRIDPTQPASANWLELVSESEQRIQQFAVVGRNIFIIRTERFSTKIESFRLDGTGGQEVLSCRHSSLSLLNRTFHADRLFYTHTSVFRPPTVCCYEVPTKNVSVWEEADVPLDPSTISSEETTYPSKDGTAIPIFFVARRDLLRRRPLPTFLTGYGGFGACVTPRFSALGAFLIEQGFLFAVPAIRGGGELGNQWHSEATRRNRQKAFDDFIAAAEWLEAEGLSRTDQIAVGGGSNGGLLVGAAITQRPELFRAAVCLGPLLDMIRYHHFDFSSGWADEYGSPNDEDDFHSLLAYSPYQNVRKDTAYPAVMFVSGDADTRCNPMHARKMAAMLQQSTSSRHPILLDYRPTWGHVPAQPLGTRIDALTDRVAFICHELDISLKGDRSQ